MSEGIKLLLLLLAHTNLTWAYFLWLGFCEHDCVLLKKPERVQILLINICAYKQNDGQVQ